MWFARSLMIVAVVCILGSAFAAIALADSFLPTEVTRHEAAKQYHVVVTMQFKKHGFTSATRGKIRCTRYTLTHVNCYIDLITVRKTAACAARGKASFSGSYKTGCGSRRDCLLETHMFGTSRHNWKAKTYYECGPIEDRTVKHA